MLFFRGTVPKCKVHFWRPPFKCKIGRWTSPRCRFCGESCQNTFDMYTFSRPPSKTPWKMELTFWVRPPLKRVVILYTYTKISTHCHLKIECNEAVHDFSKHVGFTQSSSTSQGLCAAIFFQFTVPNIQRSTNPPIALDFSWAHALVVQHTRKFKQCFDDY